MNGTYGTTKPANINIERDIDIYYNYKPNRSYENSNVFETLNKGYILKAQDSEGVDIDGLYNLKLPLSIFNKKGIYTVYIKPKEISLNIFAVGTLSGYPDVRGVIFKKEDFTEGLTGLTGVNALVGYRIEYNGNDGNYTRIITSSNPCGVTPTPSGNKFTIGNGGALLFCTVTPSTANSFTPTSPPSIGVGGDTVRLVNTNFNPVMFEIEMVEHDAETLSYMLEGDQVRNLENGTFTIYNKEQEIYKQYETYTVKTRLGRPLYDIKRSKDIVDSSQSYNNTINNS